MTSRLDRLFILLETGSSAVTRQAAARQLGEVQRLHPHELHNLLARVYVYLRSTTWETRIAAGHAVEAIIKNVPLWDPVSSSIKKETHTQSLSLSGRMKFQVFDINKVLANRAYLMGSEGKEYDCVETTGVNMKEYLARQRQVLNSRLGIDGTPDFGLNVGDLIVAEDLCQTESQKYDFKKSAGEAVQEEMCGTMGLSAREINRARRKARQSYLKQHSVDISEAGSVDENEPHRKRIKTERKSQDGDYVPDLSSSWNQEAVEWPFESFCDQLCQDLFSPCWEIRHGVATALREIIRVHGSGAGKSVDCTKEEMEECHQAWLEDMALRLVCVLALDRFGDFVSDQVVAPVRETCAQALGCVLHLMSEQGVFGVLHVLLELLKQPEWEVRHGGLLGIKYLLAVQQDLVGKLLPITFPFVLAGLNDPVDDVGAVAASALIPVASTLVTILPSHIEVTVQRLWDLLVEQDELAAACNSFMGLLAALLSLPHSQNYVLSHSSCDVVPRLWPFLCHNTSSVRRATLQTLYTLTSRKEGVHPNNIMLNWTPGLLQEALRHVFQRMLVETVSDIQRMAEQVWSNLIENSPLGDVLLAACPYVSTWLCLAMQPSKVPFDQALLIRSKPLERSSEKSSRRPRAFTALDNDLQNESNATKTEEKYFLGGTETTPSSTRETNVTRIRCMSCRMLGVLSCYIVRPAPGIVYTPDMETPIDCYVKVLLVYLNSKSALQRMVAGLVIAEWAKLDKALTDCPPALKTKLHECLNESVYFDEIAMSYAHLLQDVRDFLAMLKHYKMPLDFSAYGKILTMDQIQQLTGPISQKLLCGAKIKAKAIETLEERRKSIQTAVSQTNSDQMLFTVSTQATLAGAVTMLNCLPDKLNPVVKPLMESIKREENEHLQSLSAQHLAKLVDLCLDRVPSPNSKIIPNLCTFLRLDPEFTPRVSLSNEADKNCNSQGCVSESLNMTDNYKGILTLMNQQKSAERAAFRRSNSTTGRGPGRPPLTDIPLDELFAPEDDSQKMNRIQRRGAAFALTAICSYFGADLPTKLPLMWEMIIGKLKMSVDISNFDPSSFINKDSVAEELIGNLQVLEVTSPAIHSDLFKEIFSILPHLCILLTHPYRAVRHMSSRCLGTLALLSSVPVMTHVVDRVLPLLGSLDNDTNRQGAVEALACITEKLQMDIVPYIVLLVVPLLGRMSDPDQDVRLMATHCFATLIQLMPLDGIISDPPNLTTELALQKSQERKFLEHLFQPKSIEDYKVPVPIQAELRSYQQSGINWLAFLNRYKLHGILCDDMGLGKTLQSICILAGDHYYRHKSYEESRSPDCAPLPSIVICPPTLTGHWVYEVKKFLPNKFLRPLQYVGTPVERIKLRCKVKNYNLIVASYDIVRKDISFFSSLRWNYCILDEGHVIKNGKTKSSKAVKQLKANHRLILSGTPIQNNVLELWSLFDFLMPGFLGTEKQFTARYSKPILASRDAKSSPKEQEAGVLAMEALHRQVLPFLLRRMKEDVLQDLPPKITQDYYCELSPLQEQLYEDFSHSQAHQSLQETLATAGPSASMQGNTHIFQALRYLQNVCNHPKLVLTPTHSQYERINADLKHQNSNLDDIHHAAKLPALKQLLLDCGIGVSEMQTSELIVSQHRALIFCQLKAMLDILENDLFKKNMPSVSYLRLDGTVPPGLRQQLVTQFNNDPTIDVLILTTQVGGLGLNLTGADTVIFVEHDWNPMKDLQAMDRAHRIGQKKVVNVYRLITRGTLEEKIMGLQKFKLLTANTVISSENASMETMGTDQLLDLFSLDSKCKNESAASGSKSVCSTKGGISMKTVLENLPDLWDDEQYEKEYDVNKFVRTFQK